MTNCVGKTYLYISPHRDIKPNLNRCRNRTSIESPENTHRIPNSAWSSGSRCRLPRRARGIDNPVLNHLHEPWASCRRQKRKLTRLPARVEGRLGRWNSEIRRDNGSILIDCIGSIDRIVCVSFGQCLEKFRGGR